MPAVTRSQTGSLPKSVETLSTSMATFSEGSQLDAEPMDSLDPFVQKSARVDAGDDERMSEGSNVNVMEENGQRCVTTL